MADQELTEELDYRITFPSPTSGDFSVGESGESEGIPSVQPEPVVILLGWVGCQEKHLAKYADIWEAKGCITIQYTCPTDVLYYKRGALIPTAKKILELVTDLNLEDNPILFHVFSNGGSFLYRNIIDVLHSEPEFGTLRMAGTIFDSAPAPGHLSTGLKAFMSSLNTNVFVKYFLTFLLILYMLILLVIHKCAGLVGIVIPIPYADFWVAMKDDPSRWPQMYLFSENDEIVLASDVKEMVAHRKSLGIEVMQQCWEDSDHVNHLRTHREGYMKYCYDFLSLCTLYVVTSDSDE